jgi:lysophospholipase L1-like esterase
LGEDCVDAQGNTTTNGGSNGGPGQTQGIKFLIIGDSLSVGLKPKFKTLIEADGGVLVNKSTGEDSENRSGTTITQWANSYASQSLDSYASNKPNIVIISLGTNDAAAQRTEQQVKTDTSKLIQVLQSKSVGKIIWIGPPKFTSTTSEGGSRTKYPTVNNTTVPVVIAGIKSGQSGCYYDTYTKTINIYPPKYNEIHPAGDGYAAWAQAVWTSYKTSGC